jgi:tetratricopeptide (TPR) repeat protein
MRGARAVLLLVVGLCPAAARAGEPAESRARALYAAGQEAFVAGRYPEALERFRQAYAVLPAPALLYNMASALEPQGQPLEAADKLRAYLHAFPDAPDRLEIESRVRALEEAQRAIDAAKLKGTPPRLLELAPDPRAARRRKIVATVTAIGVTLAVGAVGLGLGLGLKQDYPDSTLHTQRATP